MGLLDELLTEGKKYLRDAMPGGLLNPEISNQSVLDGAAIASSPVPVIGDLLGLGADLHRYAKQPEERTAGNFALTGLGMLPFIPSMTAWHGSPHKFDKFSLDKIGTGEGAQAYGHGLYLAEHPDVAQTYKATAPYVGRHVQQIGLDAIKQSGGDIGQARALLNQQLTTNKDQYLRQPIADALNNIEDIAKGNVGGNLYKTDIPDEAVARFLDWDAPLSKQPEGVRVAVQDLGLPANATGKDAYNALANLARDGAIARGNNAATTLGGSQSAASVDLQGYGIPGIRYLDGGSRSAGQGSSNFVAFDPEMIRILERNGQATGNKPWQPGEYKLGDLLK